MNQNKGNQNKGLGQNEQQDRSSSQQSKQQQQQQGGKQSGQSSKPGISSGQKPRSQQSE